MGVVGCGWVWLGVVGCGWVWLGVVGVVSRVSRLSTDQLGDDAQHLHACGSCASSAEGSIGGFVTSALTDGLGIPRKFLGIPKKFLGIPKKFIGIPRKF